jgi:hypothetical protein
MDAGEGAAAETDGANGADGVVIGQADESALGLFVDGHCGNHGNTHAGADHADKAAELAAFENDLRMKAGAIAGGKGVFAETMAIAEEEKRFRAKFL